MTPRTSSAVRRLEGVGRGALVVLAAALPFELVAPLGRLGPLQLSSVELALYVVLALWAASRAAMLLSGGGLLARWRRPASEVHLAAVGWALVLIVSAVLAPVTRPPAVKFALRSLGGVALFWAAADLLDSPGAIRRTALGLAAGAFIAALAMVAETLIPGFPALLRPFHAQTFQVFGITRASGPFQYPNIATMYLEAVLPVTVAAGLMAAGRLRLAATALVALVMGYALILTASRAGLVTAVVVLLGLAACAARERPLRALALTLAIALAVQALVVQSTGSPLALRLRFWRDHAWYRSTIQPSPAAGGALPPRCAPGAEMVVGLEVRNDGQLTWLHAGERAVHVSYHWNDERTGGTLASEGMRSSLPSDVPPGGSAIVAASVRAPARPGRYLFRWELVQEHVSWFSDQGDSGHGQPVEVANADAPSPGPLAPALSDRAPPPRPRPRRDVSRRELWRAGIAAWREHPLTGLGPDNFRRVYGRYLGLHDADDRLHANNLYVETLANLGAAGLLALLVLLAALARAARRGARTPSARVLALGLGAALAAYVVHGLLDYFLEFTPTYGLFWLLAGMLVAATRAGARVAPLPGRETPP